MRSLPLPLPLLLLLPLAACDSPSGFAGDYQITSLTRATGSCDATPVAETIDPQEEYFQLADDELLGQEFVGWHSCDGPGACDDAFDLFRMFIESDGDWKSEISSSFSPPCNLGYTVSTLVRVDATTIRVETRHYEEVDESLTGDACGYEEAEKRKTSMPCTEASTLTAVAITP